MGVTQGNNPVATPIITSNLGSLKITQVDAGNVNSLALAENGSVFSFGQNLHGGTGLGISSGVTTVATPIDTTNLGTLKIAQLAVGTGGQSLLLAENGSVFSFGPNSRGATGQGTETGDTLVATPINTTNLGSLKITQLDTDSHHSLLLAEDGRAFSFGRNTNGATGLGTATGETWVATPIDTSILGGRRVTQVSAGFNYSLLLAEDGTVFSFGDNANGQTGLGTGAGETLVATPIDTSILGGRKVTQVAASSSHSLLLAENGSVFSFGSNVGGALGRTGNATVAAPIDTTNLSGMTVIDIAAGTYYSLLVAELTSPPGDYNFNGVVDAADYVVWRKTLGQLVPPGTGADGNGNGEITQLDYLYWRQRFGNSTSSGSGAVAIGQAAVPEPAAVLLLLAGGLGFVCVRLANRG